MTEYRLQMLDIAKSFPGVQALKGVSLQCYPGEIHALVGENGAGKSTLMKVLAGAQQPDRGTIIINGEAQQLADPRAARTLGISAIYQEFNLLPHMTVAENITLGDEPRGRYGWLKLSERDAVAQAALDLLGARIHVQQPLSELSVAEQQLVEISKALWHNAEIIIMDEPSAALTDAELEKLFEIIGALKVRGVTVLYVSHRLEEIFHIAERVTVLKDGERIGTLPVAETSEGQIVQMMVGRKLSQLYPSDGHLKGDVVLEVRQITTDRLHELSFQLRRGEILGIAGLVGAGRTELVRALFGAEPILSGDVILEGQSLLPLSPARAIDAGIGFVTEDRKEEGLILDLSVRQNITLPSLRRFQRLGFMREEAEAVVARRAVEELRIQTPGIEQAVRYLSGGNQQKVVLAKWLNIEGKRGDGSGPAVLLFDEPTRGVDVGAKAEIYELMRVLTRRGMAILMVSSELPEILGMSDRILVMRDGYLAGELAGATAGEEAIVTLAAGTAASNRQRPGASATQASTPTGAVRAIPGIFANVPQGVIVVYGVLALLLLAGMALSPSFRNPANLFTILRQAVPLGLVSIGQTIAMLAGGIDLSVSSVITLASLLSASLIAGRVGLVLPVILLCLGVGALFGLVNGWTSSRLRVDPFIVTLGTMSIGRGLALVYARGPVGSVPPAYQALAYQTVGPVPVAVLLLAVVFAGGLIILRRTRFGRHIYAVGGNPEVARLAGIDVHRIKIAAFVISGMLAAATGLFMSSRMGSGDPNVGPGFELDSITAVIVGGTVLGGGRGGLVGTLGGVLLIALLSNLLNQMNVGNWYQQIIKGLILLIAVAAYWKRGRAG